MEGVDGLVDGGEVVAVVTVEAEAIVVTTVPTGGGKFGGRGPFLTARDAEADDAVSEAGNVPGA